jgi:V/A-type H+-transporting ATPase subunit I
MRWADAALPVRMRRVALVAPADVLRDMLVSVAAAGTVEIDDAGREHSGAGTAARRLRHAGRPVPEPALLAASPDLDRLEQAGRYDLLAGEAELEDYAAAAVRRSGAAALAGWIPADRLPDLAARLAEVGGAVVPLPRPRGVDAPTLLGGRELQRTLTPLVQTYGTVPYADIDPTWLAWLAYVLMFGMMFGDAGQGILLVAAGAALRAGWPRWARRFQAAWPFVAGAGLAATVFGVLYGEFFGPTGTVPAIWLDPLSHPVTLLLAAAGIGAILIAGAYALGAVNRWREGGWPATLYAPSGIAGSLLFLGIGLGAAGWYFHQGPLLAAGVAAAVTGLALALAGFLAEAGGSGAGIVQALVELLDMSVRLGSNVVSFTRLAAFGLTHAALGLLVWEGTRALWHGGGLLTAAGVAVFAVGTALAFSLEALVAAVQALRLEYYELFSRIFVTQGRPFRPWRLPTVISHNTFVLTMPSL